MFTKGKRLLFVMALNPPVGQPFGSDGLMGQDIYCSPGPDTPAPTPWPAGSTDQPQDLLPSDTDPEAGHRALPADWNIAAQWPIPV